MLLMLPLVVALQVSWLVLEVKIRLDNPSCCLHCLSLIAHSFGKMALGCAAIGGTMYTYEASGQLKGQFANKTREEKKEHSKSFFKQTKLTEEE